MRRLTNFILLGWFGLGLCHGLRAEPLADGAKIPAARMVTPKGKTIDLEKYAAQEGKRNLLLVFFRTGTCNVCVTQLRDIAAHYEQVTANNAVALGISLDDAIVQSSTAEKMENKFPLLLDPEGKIVKAFGIFNPEDKLSRPSIYLVGSDHKVLYHYVGKSLQDRPPLTEVMEVVRHYSGGLPKRASAKAN